MNRPQLVGAMTCAAIIGIAGCGGMPEDAETTSSALTTAISQVRGYTRANGQHAIIYTDPVFEVIRNSGTPPGAAQQMGGNLATGCSPWGYKRAGTTHHPSVEAVLYVDPTGDVHEITPTAENNFVDSDLTSVFNFPKAASETSGVPDVIGYVRTDQRNAVIYRAKDTNDIIELASNFEGRPVWLFADLTTISGGPPVSKGGPFPYVRSDNRNTIVYVGGPNNHIHELAGNFNGSPTWIDADLSDISGDTSTPSTSPWGYKRNDNTNAVVFVDTLGHMVEISYTQNAPCSGHSWCTAPLPATFAATGFRPSGYVRADGLSTVVYMSGSSIRELALLPTGWDDKPLPMVISSNGHTISALGAPFGHRPPVDRASVLFRGQDTVSHDILAYEIHLPVGSGWSISGI